MARRPIPGELETVARQLLIGARSIFQRGTAKFVASIAEDVRDVVAEGEGRLGKFIAGCEEIARQGRDTEPPPPAEPPPPYEPTVVTSRQTPRAKKRQRRGARRAR
jgi:hypothetical protein